MRRGTRFRQRILILVRGIRLRQRLGRQARMRAAKIRGGRVLTDVDDAFADGAGTDKLLVERIGVAAPDRLGQRRDVLVEAAEHFQDRVLVGEEHVAPHGRIGGSDASEIAEAAG